MNITWKWPWKKEDKIATRSYTDVDDMFEEIESESDTLWFKITLPFYRTWYHFKNIPYYCRMRFRYQHYLVKMPQVSKWTWCDTDHRILHANMELVCQFIDNEKPYDRIEWNSDDGHKTAYDTMREVYAWWKNYPNRVKEYDDTLTAWADIRIRKQPEKSATKQELWDKMNKMEADLENETTVMLHKIIDIRGYLWT